MIKSSGVVIAALLLAYPAAAANLDQAKSNGQVCEQTDGYLRANAGAPGDVQALVADVNGKRQAEYAKIATKNGVGVDQVAKLTAQKVINGAPQFACR